MPFGPPRDRDANVASRSKLPLYLSYFARRWNQTIGIEADRIDCNFDQVCGHVRVAGRRLAVGP